MNKNTLPVVISVFLIVLALGLSLSIRGGTPATPTVSETPVTAAPGAATPTGTPPAEEATRGCMLMRVFIHNTPVFTENGRVVQYLSAPTMSSPARVTACAVTPNYVFVKLGSGEYGYVYRSAVDAVDLIGWQNFLPAYSDPF